MSTDRSNPFYHPDILPSILLFCTDKTLARLMQCSRHIISAIVHDRYPHITVDSGKDPSTTRQPNTQRQDLPVDAKWFSAPFAAYIARYARVVEVKGHASWWCPPKGLMLGVENGTGRPGVGVEECGVEIKALRLTRHGACHGTERANSHPYKLQSTAGPASPCQSLAFFRPTALSVEALFLDGHIQIPSTVTMSSSVERLTIELDVTVNCSDTRVQRSLQLPACRPLGPLLMAHVKDIYIVLEPNALYLKRAEGIRHGDMVSMIARLISDAEAYNADSVVMDSSGRSGDVDSVTNQDQRPSRTYFLVNLGQLNPSWAHRKVWNEHQLQDLILPDIREALSHRSLAHVTLIGLTAEQYYNDRTVKSETPPQLHVDRLRAYKRQSETIKATAKRAAVREKQASMAV